LSRSLPQSNLPLSIPGISATGKLNNMNLDQFEFVSWEKLHQWCFQLSQKIIQKELRLDKIVAISRGGLVVARILSDFLNLPISHITIVAYKEIGKMEEPKVTEGLGVTVSKKKLLLVDEIVDSGKSLSRGKKYLDNFAPGKVFSAAPVVKPKANPKPDYYIHSTDKWVVFPYEVRETTEQLVSDWINKGFSKQEIKKNLIKLGFKNEMVKQWSGNNDKVCI